MYLELDWESIGITVLEGGYECKDKWFIGQNYTFQLNELETVDATYVGNLMRVANHGWVWGDC
jgi:hypothetical protein